MINNFAPHHCWTDYNKLSICGVTNSRFAASNYHASKLSNDGKMALHP